MDRSKPMDVFGPEWENHAEKLQSNWNRVVGSDDLVIVAGDISWAMRLPEAVPDLQWLGALKGTKLLIRGNHDYWWSSVSKVRAVLPPTVHALQNDHFTWDGRAVCGTRGWICPGEEGYESEHDQKLYRREAGRLRLSLESAARQSPAEIIAALHFPPYNRRNRPSEFTDLLEYFSVKLCVFGHIHDSGRDFIFQGKMRGTEYRFVAADGINFTPLRLI